MRTILLALVALCIHVEISLAACDCRETGVCPCGDCHCFDVAQTITTHAERQIPYAKPSHHETAKVTGNFVVRSPDAAFSRRILVAAEKYRRQLSLDWFGSDMPDWSAPCPIYVTFARGNGGNTSFIFDGGEVFGWRMEVQGTPDGILNAVLPHEVLHTVFASQLRTQLPRWADEGACSTIEPRGEVRRLHLALNEFLKTGRGLPFNTMVSMMHYPADIMPVYAQGESVADFLLQLDGKQYYAKRFLLQGARSGDWKKALLSAYGHESLGRLQNDWLAWYRAGSPRNAELQGERHSVGYQCGSGGCGASFSQGRFIRRPTFVRDQPNNPPLYVGDDGQPDTPIVKSKPAPKPAQPAAPSVNDTVTVTQSDNGEVLAAIEKLQQQITALENTPGQPGMPGEAGPTGPAGPQGPAGKDGTAGEDADASQISALEQQINILQQQLAVLQKQLPAVLTIDTVDAGGNVLASEQIRIGTDHLTVEYDPVQVLAPGVAASK